MPETAAKSAQWTTFAFGDVVRQVKDKVDPEQSGLERYIAGEHMDTDNLRIRRWGEIGGGYLGPAFHMRFKPGHVLYGSRRTYLRKVALADFEGITANTTYVLESKDPDVLLPELLPFVMQTESFHAHSKRESKGSVNPYVNFSDLAWYEFNLPPVEGQRRISEALRAAETTINAWRRLCTDLKALRASAIDELTFRLAANRSTVGEHCEMQNGRPFPGAEYCDDGELLLRPGNLDPSGYLAWSEGSTKRVPHRYRQDASEFLVAPGDVLINLTAQSLEDGFMGRVCLARDGDESLLNQRIGRFRRFSGRLLPEYLFRVLQSSNFQRHAKSMCEGSKIKHLFWQHIGPFEFPFPSPAEQARVTGELRSIDAATTDTERRLRSAKRLKKRLLRAVLDDGEGSSA
jgi:type I restriction enzyme, S subunit